MDILWKSRKRWLFFGIPWTFTKYTLKKDKFLVDTGVFSKTQDEIRLYRILDLTLTRSFGQRIFGLGTIICKTTDKTMPDLVIKNIRKSGEVKELLSEQVEKERIEKRVSSREYMGSVDIDDTDDNELHL